jgi:hypothetical protein
MSTLAATLVILGVLIVLLTLVSASWMLLAVTYKRTRSR